MVGCPQTPDTIANKHNMQIAIAAYLIQAFMHGIKSTLVNVIHLNIPNSFLSIYVVSKTKPAFEKLTMSNVQ